MFSNSPLVSFVLMSPNFTKPRNQSIKKITIHHTAGMLSLESLARLFQPEERQASSNYGIDINGKIGMFVEEKHRAWTSANAENDHQAVTYEVCNSTNGPAWEISGESMEALINLSVDVCFRNPGIKQADGQRGLSWTGDKKGSLTIHKFFANTNCPGPYLEPRMGQIAAEVNKRLAAKLKNQNGNEELEMPYYLVRKYQFCDDNIPLGLKDELQEAIDMKIVGYGEFGFDPALSEQDVRTLAWIMRWINRLYAG